MIKGLLVLALCALLHGSSSEQVGDLSPEGRANGENHAHNVYNVMRESAELLNKMDDTNQRQQEAEHAQRVWDSQNTDFQSEHAPTASRDDTLRSRVHGTSFLERDGEMVEAQTENLIEAAMDEEMDQQHEEQLPSFLKKAVNSVSNVAKAVGNVAAKGAVNLKATVKINAPGIATAVKNVGAQAASSIKAVSAQAASAAKNIGSQIKARAPAVLNNLKKVGNQALNKAGQAARAAAPHLQNAARQAFNAAKQFGSGLGNGLTAAYTAGLNGKRALGSLPAGRNGFTGAGGRLKEEDNQCVMCQYFVQRIKGFVVENSAPLVFAEESATVTTRTRQTGKWAVPHFTDDLAAEQKREQQFEAAKEKPGYAEAETVPRLEEALQEAAEDVRSTDYQSVHEQQQQQAKKELVPESHPRHPKHRKAALERDMALLAKKQQAMEDQSEQAEATVQYVHELHHSATQESSASTQQEPEQSSQSQHESSSSTQQEQEQEQEPGIFEPEYTDSLDGDKHTALLQQHERAFALAHEQGKTDQLASGPVESAPAAVMLEQAAQASAKAAEKAEFIAHRFRDTDMRDYRSGDKRFDITRVPAPNAATQQQRYQFEVMSAMVYQSFVRFCTGRMPEPYFSQCGTLVGSYRTIAEGIHYGDRPDEICVRMELCKIDSYIQSSPHALYREDITSGNRMDLYGAGGGKK